MDYRTTKFKGIIPFSGGIDSSASLYKTLKDNPNDNYLVYFVKLINGNSGNRILQEERAMHQILDKLGELGMNNFVLKKTEFDYSSLGPPPVWDSEIINFVAAVIVQDKPEISEFIEGAIWNDFQQEGFDDRIKKIADIFYTASGRTEENFKMVFPIRDMKKYEVMTFIPREVLELTWSCRYPEIGPPYTFVRCHKCPQCTLLDRVLEEHGEEFGGILT